MVVVDWGWYSGRSGLGMICWLWWIGDCMVVVVDCGWYGCCSGFGMVRWW